MKGDAEAIEQCINAGVGIVTSIHGSDRDDVMNSSIGYLAEKGIFRKYNISFLVRKVPVQLRRLKVLKIIGIIGLITASGLAGIMKAYRLKRRIYLLEDYMKMIMDLKSRINYMKEPLLISFEGLKKQTIPRQFIFYRIFLANQ